jgi:F0F1-type ATP synthase membrane subunit c/vacuolar-type H+-ATPase subunit K
VVGSTAVGGISVGGTAVGISVGGTVVGAGVAAGAHAANTIEATTTKPNRVGQRIARNIFFLLPNWIYYFLARLGLSFAVTIT